MISTDRALAPVNGRYTGFLPPDYVRYVYFQPTPLFLLGQNYDAIFYSPIRGLVFKKPPLDPQLSCTIGTRERMELGHPSYYDPSSGDY